MNDLLSSITWQTKGEGIQDLLLQKPKIEPMKAGLEADVYRIQGSESTFVLKIWNRDSKPDISLQYKLLEAMYAEGIAVSKPVGWGFDPNRHQVLLTSYDGEPIREVNKLKIETLADILIDIHNFQIEKLGSNLPAYDFVSYFFPRVDEHKKIRDRLEQLVGQSAIKQSHLIHGDFNFGNILEAEGKHTIIDWTNGQLGDPRFDIAWSILLVTIYVSERFGAIYHSCFVNKQLYSADELEIFEAIACLRWLLMSRSNYVPKPKKTLTAVNKILAKNQYLDEGYL